MRKAHTAKVDGAESLQIWGSGKPRREFLHVDDCADALVHLAKSYSDFGHVNVGSGDDLTISELARLVSKVVGFEGDVVTDPTKADGTPRKLMSADKLRSLGWSPRIDLEAGVSSTYQWFLENFV